MVLIPFTSRFSYNFLTWKVDTKILTEDHIDLLITEYYYVTFFNLNKVSELSCDIHLLKNP